MANNANNLNNSNKGNKVNNIPPPPTVEGLYRMIHRLQDQNRKLMGQVEAMNWDNARKENEANSHQNNGDPTEIEEENNIKNTHGRIGTYQTTTTQGLPVYSGPFSEFIMSVAFLDNFKLLTTLRPYDGTGDP